MAPHPRLKDYLNIITDPSRADMEQYISLGERNTWPRLAAIVNHHIVEKLLRESEAILRRRLVNERGPDAPALFSPQGPAARGLSVASPLLDVRTPHNGSDLLPSFWPLIVDGPVVARSDSLDSLSMGTDDGEAFALGAQRGGARLEDNPEREPEAADGMEPDVPATQKRTLQERRQKLKRDNKQYSSI